MVHCVSSRVHLYPPYFGHHDMYFWMHSRSISFYGKCSCTHWLHRPWTLLRILYQCCTIHVQSRFTFHCQTLCSRPTLSPITTELTLSLLHPQYYEVIMIVTWHPCLKPSFNRKLLLSQLSTLTQVSLPSQERFTKFWHTKKDAVIYEYVVCLKMYT